MSLLWRHHEEERPKPKPKPVVTYPHATGGGWYELSNGERVQGKKEARKAEKSLKVGD